ncbi:hypothetical protein HTZ84_09930 [Haloterrigena sp. SYSU A558-1]|uniref:Uncharacterized protein n=1 Tax=Haloterrigena gelatinilytica TaxID=2741724 RepID=A0ABX2L8P0_9EURY|nr:hypothetical protein [Haloterrigena gelatinilytica]NUC72624.1 hypothetical protein [Haloterrigena gelatinilytica]
MLSLREWFRDEDGWTTPDGRRGELVELVVALPVFAFFATRETGVPLPTAHPAAVVLGALCGFCYAVYWRERVLSLIPEQLRTVAVSTFLGGGVGLSVLRIVHLAAPAVLFVVAAGTTIAAIYAAWLCSPLEDGLRPPRRGVEPPSSLESSESPESSAPAASNPSASEPNA